MNGIDPENGVVRLCVAGVQAEQAGDGERAAELYRQAWDARGTDLEASMAAHYLARVQADDRARLAWNRTALDHAEVAGEATATFLPSLLLNLGHSLEMVGELADASAAYDRAERALANLEPFAGSLRAPLDRARRRVAEAVRARSPGKPAR